MWTGGFLAVVLAALLLFILFGLNTLRSPIAGAVSKATGRELKIEGDLRAVWSWTHPRFRIENVVFANPEWGREKFMFAADAIEATVSVLPLFAGRVVLPEVHLQGAEVNLEYAADGRKNWLFEKDQKKEGGSRVFIRALTLEEGTLRYYDPARGTDIEASLASNGDDIVFDVTGFYRGLEASVVGQGGPAMALRDAEFPYPLRAEGKIGETAFDANGSITSIVDLSELDLDIALKGKTMSQLYDVLGIAFPETSPYQTRGRLLRDKDAALVRYENFSGKVGESDLAGTFQVDTKTGTRERPFMHGDLVSKVLNFADLGPLVGTDQPKQGGVLPDSPFDASRWDSVDADVRIRAGTIKRPQQLPLDNLTTRIRMRDKVLTLDPLEFGVAGGRIVGPIVLDGRKDTIRGETRLRVEKLQLAKLFPTLKEAQASIGDVTGIIEVAGTGNSVSKMLGASDGKIGLFIDGGRMSAFLAQLMALDLWGVARVKLGGEKEVEIRCAIADFAVKDGVARATGLVFDTSVVNVEGGGSLNFKNEALDFRLEPHPKDASFASLKSPLYVRGTLGKPDVKPDMTRLAMKGVGAIVMGIINPLLAVLPMLQEGGGKDSNCAQLIAAAVAPQKPVATSSTRSAASGATKPRPPVQPERQSRPRRETPAVPPGSGPHSETPLNQP